MGGGAVTTGAGAACGTGGAWMMAVVVAGAATGTRADERTRGASTATRTSAVARTACDDDVERCGDALRTDDCEWLLGKWGQLEAHLGQIGHAVRVRRVPKRVPLFPLGRLDRVRAGLLVHR